jgi:cell division protein FtsQ
LPSTRSFAVGAALIILIAGGYAIARETPIFAIRSIEVEGAAPGVTGRVRSALEPLRKTNLVAFDAQEGRKLAAQIPYVASVRFDRAFPNTLRVIVTPERPVAVLRRGRDAWIVSGRARVLSKIKGEPPPSLPRIWLARSSEPLVGAVLSDEAADVVRALVPMSGVRLPVAIRSAKSVDGELTVVLASGVEVLLGDPYELRLKLSVVARVLPIAGDAAFIDASVPDRVVTGPRPLVNSQVEGRA